MTLLLFTQGATHGIELLVVPSLRINVGAWAPDPVRPWQPAHPFWTKSCAPSLAVPCPGGSSFPSGLIEISQAWISSAVGVRPTPKLGDCADPRWHSPRIIASKRSLRKPIVHAPIASHLPRLNGIVGAWDAEFVVQRLVPVLGGLGSRRLNGAQVVGAARHEHTLLSIPFPGEAEPGVGHSIRRRPELGVVAAAAGVGGDLHLANRSTTG